LRSAAPFWTVIASSPFCAPNWSENEMYACPGVLGENLNTAVLVSPEITWTAEPQVGVLGVVVAVTVGGHSVRVHVPVAAQL
jgi:hypothetical protein